MSLTPAQIKPKSFNRDEPFSVLFTRGGCVSDLRACLGARLLLLSYQYPNLSEGADRVGGQPARRKRVLFQWRKQIWQSLEEGAGKRCSECGGKAHSFHDLANIVVSRECQVRMLNPNRYH